MSPTEPGPRLLRPEEFEACMALVNDCFGHDPGSLEDRMPHCFDPAHPERHAVIERGGDLVAHAVCVPGELRAGDARVDCAGIAGVATHPDHRGDGHMDRLLEFWLERLDERATPLAELEGDRVRYGRYGWENAGREDRYRITDRSFDLDVDPGEERVRPYRPSDLEWIRELHDRERYRVSRDRRRYERLFDQTGLETLVVEGESAYCCHRGHNPTAVLEFGGTPRGVGALLDALLDAGALEVYTHPRHPLASLFRRVATDWTSGPHRKLAVLDLPATVEAYEPLLAERWDRLEGAVGEFTLAVDGEDESVTITSNRDGLAVDRTDREPDVSLSPRETVDFLFGPADVHRPIKRSWPALDVLLPLEYYFWQTETV